MLGKRGFTLIELLVTIVVIGIITMMAAPFFTSTVSKQKLMSTTRDFIETLSNTRSQATLIRTSFIVCPNKKLPNNANSITLDSCADYLATYVVGGVKYNGLSPTDKSAEKNKLVAGNRVILADIPEKFTLKSDSDASVIFTPFGRAVSESNFTICDNNIKSRVIAVSLMGTVNQTEGNC